MTPTRHRLSLSETRPPLIPALHYRGTSETPAGCPGSEADFLGGLFSGIKPAHPPGVSRFRPSMCGGLSEMWRHRRECGTGGSPKPQADANPIEAGPLRQMTQCVKIGHGAGSSIKTGSRDTKGVCADVGETLRVRILSALQLRDHRLTAAPDDGDGRLQQARSSKSEQNLAILREVLSFCSDFGSSLTNRQDDMKHESKFGLGEIVIVTGATDNRRQGTDLSDRHPDDELGKVVGVLFHIGHPPTYHIRYCDRAGRQCNEILPEVLLISDPEFDQERGCYPEKEDE